MPRVGSEPAILFYDGHCGLCHRTVKFVLKRDRSGKRFRFAPLQGSTFQERVPAERRPGLPESMVVLTGEGALLVRSRAVFYILGQVGGGWRILGRVLGVIPRALADAAYDRIAGSRYRVFGRREELCPVTDPTLRARFDP